jgi:multidrug efflux system membrane fusion protein
VNRLAAVLLLAALAACKPPEQPRSRGNLQVKPRVTTVTAAAREIEYAIEASGSIQASEEISIPASVSGIVDRVTFKEGDAVTPETVLVEIEVEKFKLGEDRAKAEHERAQAQATLAETLYTNRLKLSEEGKKQNKEYVTAEQMATWRADLEKAKAEVGRTRAELELARRDHRNARVRSPIEGLLNAKLVSKGEFVRPETIVATILNISPLHVRFTVPELEASRLRHGQMLSFAVRSAPGRAFAARLFWLSQKADPITRSVECKAEVQGRDEALRAGTFAQVTLITGRHKGLAVPERAVLPTERGFVLFVLDGTKARSVLVRLGLRLDGLVEIAEGLKEGDRVVVDGALTLRDGLEVEVVDDTRDAKPAQPAKPAAGGVQGS